MATSSRTVSRVAGLFVKRVFDVTVSLVLLVLLSPLFAVVAIAVRLRMGSPVLFGQMRPGRNEELFRLIKFRSMVPDQGTGPKYREDYDRITPLGRFLRRYGLDELPELINVIRGDMSLVGPRPLLVEFLPKYTTEEARRHEMRPGVTGLAQVSGRQGLLYSRKLQFDVEYVDNWSLWLDIKILVRTVGAVFGSMGKDEEEDADDLDDIGLMPDRARRKVGDES
jgi:lipopolysaccharide/colanic/teichoic acid biosynthesis glycosyltransferase